MAKARTDTLEAALQNLFTGGDTTRVSWFALTGGEQLFGEGDPADTLYLVRSGRLGVFCHDGDQTPRFLGVVRPGEPVGEMSMLAGTPHTASVVALRDSEILALPRETFFEAARSQPDLMVELSRLMIRRSRDKTLGGSEPSVFGFISARPKPIRAFVERIAACIEADGFTCQIIDHSALTSVADWFSRVEDSHDYVLYVAEADEPAWAQLCTRQVDRLFIVGNPLNTPPGANLPRNPALDAQQRTDLILLRDPRMPRPANTSVWLDAVKPGRWFQAMDGHLGDAARLARVVTGTAVGVVLSGGGARAYAHLGALRALRDAKVPLDFMGGASMGAVIAAGPALGWSQDEMEDEIKRAFVASDPLSDITFPLIAMTRAGKVTRLLRNAFGDTEMADMALPYFAVSTNLTTGRIEVHKRGLLRRAMRATISIPGVMPPVVMHDQVLVDGAVLRNFPAETMRPMNAGPVIGVDMSPARGVDPATLQNPPSWWRWIRSGDWKNGPPIVALLMRAATLTSDADIETSRRATDLLIQPEPEGMDIRDWKAYDIAVGAGYEAAHAALSELDGPVTRLRQDRSRQAEAAETVTAPEPPEKASGKAKASRRRTASERPG